MALTEKDAALCDVAASGARGNLGALEMAYARAYGEGWYQARGEKAKKLMPGMVVEIPPNVEHWHGAGPKTWFAHLSIECHPETNKNTWLERVSDADYAAATKEK